MGKDMATTHTSAPWRASVLTLFPKMFPGPLGHSLAGKASMKDLWQSDTVNLYDFGDKQGRVDDSPYGGGPGMIIRAEVIEQALLSQKDDARPKVMLSPRGALFDQKMAQSWSRGPGLIVICGRYEGIDQRVIDRHSLLEISIGDYILAGGEVAAMVIIEACVRLLPGVVGEPRSIEEESHQGSLLEHPQYTRPANWRNHMVPDILLSGHHQNVQQWQHEQREHLTRTRRPDLWQRYCQENKKKP